MGRPIFNFLRLDSPEPKPKPQPQPGSLPTSTVPAPLPSRSPLVGTGPKPEKEPPLTSIENAVKEIDEAIVAINTLDSTSRHPAHEAIGRAARRKLADVAALLDRLREKIK